MRGGRKQRQLGLFPVSHSSLLPWTQKKTRSKGIMPALIQVFPNTLHAYCCQHIADNVTKQWSACCKAFWNAAYAKIKPAFDVIIANIRRTNPQCADYILEISPKNWASYAVSRSQYGQLTFNNQESVNSQWKEFRDMPITEMLTGMCNSSDEKSSWTP